MFLYKSLHDTVKTVLIGVQKGNLAFELLLYMHFLLYLHLKIFL